MEDDTLTDSNDINVVVTKMNHSEDGFDGVYSLRYKPYRKQLACVSVDKIVTNNLVSRLVNKTTVLDDTAQCSVGAREMDNGSVSELEKLQNGSGVKEKVFNCEKVELCESEESPFKRQFFVSFGTFALTLGAGAVSGFSAILLPQLKDENRRKFSTEMVSWVAAMASFALFFGNVLSGYLMEKLGRRRSQLVLSIIFTSGWIIIGFAGNVYWILLGRFITGFSQGWLGPLGPVFVGEVTSPVYRGFFLASLSLSISVGVLMSHVYGTFMHWTYSSLLCGLFPLLGGVVIYFSPESPAWLASQNRIDECIESFKWYRGSSPEMKAELDKMIAEQTKRDNSRSKMSILKTNMKKPEFWKPLGIMTIFFIMTQLSGVNVVSAYTTEMMEELFGRHSSKKYTYATMLAIDILRCVSLAVACVLLKRRGRRPMAMISGIFTSLSLIVLAIYMFTVKRKHLSPYVTLGLMTIYIIVSNLGVVPLPWNMVGELFATETKGIGSGISVMMTSFAYFATIKTAPQMFDSMGHSGTYMFYGLSTLVGTAFLYFYLPETKGKTLLQIEEYFRYGKKGKARELSKDCEPCV